MTDTFYIDDIDISYIDKMLIDGKGQLAVREAEIYKRIPSNHLSVFCHKHAFYGLPTIELIDWIKNLPFFNRENTIEIGAGNGALGRALGIRMTDSKLQEVGRIKRAYESMRQPTIKYPPDVIRATAKKAIERYKPEIVIASWVTHKYEDYNDESRMYGGNLWGVDEETLLQKVKYYIFIGNMRTHEYKPIMKIPHEEYRYDWLFSRSMYPSENFVAIWKGGLFDGRGNI